MNMILFYSSITLLCTYFLLLVSANISTNTCQFSTLCTCSDTYNAFSVECSIKKSKIYGINDTITYSTNKTTSVIHISTLNENYISERLLSTIHLQHINVLTIAGIYLNGSYLDKLPVSINKLTLYNTTLYSKDIINLKKLINLRTLRFIKQVNLTEILHVQLDTFKLIKYLYFTHNRIDFIHRHALSNLDNLISIDLRYNLLTSIAKGTIPIGTAAFFSNNPWDCHCSLRWLRDRLLNTPTNHTMYSNNDVICASPVNLVSKSLMRLQNEQLACQNNTVYMPDENITVSIYSISLYSLN